MARKQRYLPPSPSPTLVFVTCRTLQGRYLFRPGPQLQRPVPRHPRPRPAAVSTQALRGLRALQPLPPPPPRRRRPAVVELHAGPEIQAGDRGQPAHRLAGNGVRPALRLGRGHRRGRRADRETSLSPQPWRQGGPRRAAPGLAGSAMRQRPARRRAHDRALVRPQPRVRRPQSAAGFRTLALRHGRGRGILAPPLLGSPARRRSTGAASRPWWMR